MNLADQFAADAAAASAPTAPPQNLAQQFAADALAGAKQQSSSAPRGAPTPVVQAPQPGMLAPDGAQFQDIAAGGLPSFTSGQIGQIAGGAAHGIGSLANNAANLVEKGVAASVNAIPGVRGSTVGNWLTNTANSDVASQAISDQQFQQNASPGAQAAATVAPMLLPTGGMARVGNAIGDAVTALPTMGGTVGRLVGSGLGNAATGAVLSAGSQIDPNQPYWPQVARNMSVGAGAGVAVPAAIGGITGAARSVYNAARPLLNPGNYVGTQFANAVGNDAATVASKIRNAPTFVPGSTPTTAQVGATPLLVQTEKAFANANPVFKTALAQRSIDNNDARWSALMGIAGTPADVQAAEAARAATTGPLYDAAHRATANVGPAFMRYSQIPEMQDAMKLAHENASLDAAVGRGIQPVWPQQPVPGVSPGSRTINGSALDYTSRALDGMIRDAGGAGTARGASLSALQSNLDNWTNRYIPGVQKASDTYAQMSVPINTMDVGQQIANGIGTRPMNAGGAPEIQLMPYRTAFTSAMKNAPYGIDPTGHSVLQGIGQDLQRATISNSIRSPGSDTAYNLAANGWLARHLFGPNFQGGAAGRVIGGAAQAAGAAGGAALFGPAGAGVGSALGSGFGGLLNGSRISERLGNHLGGLLLNPTDFLPYLDAASARSAPSITPGLMQGVVNRAKMLPVIAAPLLAGPSSTP